MVNGVRSVNLNVIQVALTAFANVMEAAIVYLVSQIRDAILVKVEGMELRVNTHVQLDAQQVDAAMMVPVNVYPILKGKGVNIAGVVDGATTANIDAPTAVTAAYVIEMTEVATVKQVSLELNAIFVRPEDTVYLVHTIALTVANTKLATS